jgi:hypothetical protein
MEKLNVNAPKNPHEKGCRICFLYQMDLQAAPGFNGGFFDGYFLDMHRLKEKIRMMNDIRDEKILSLFDTADGFRKIVDGIGFSFEDAEVEEIAAEFIFAGKKDRMTSGTHCKVNCPADGREMLLWLDEVAWTGDDVEPANLMFHFPKAGVKAKATVVFYAKPGYDLPQFTLDPPVCFDTPAYRAMIERSLFSAGNNVRLKKAMQKIRSREPSVLAFIGGSITEGAGAKPANTECYSYLTWNSLRRKLNAPNLSYVRTGIGGTSSELGMIRFEQDVLRKGNPDILVIEFAVNDEDDETKGRCYESLIRKAMMLPNAPAVVLLFSVFSNDWNLQDRLSPVGTFYGLPMVSVLDAVVPQFGLPQEKGGVVTKRQYFCDLFHPTNSGHRIMADCLLHLFEETDKAQEDSPAEFPTKQTLMGRTFETVRYLGRNFQPKDAVIDCGDFSGRDEETQFSARDDEEKVLPCFPENWMHPVDGGAKPFTAKLKFKSLFFVFKDSGNSSFGKADIYVDGALCRTMDPLPAGWNRCDVAKIYESDVEKLHVVEVRMAAGDENKAFTILGIGLC